LEKHKERFRYKEKVTVVKAEDDESILREIYAMFPTYIGHHDEFERSQKALPLLIQQN
jgi:hypothetical protein